MMEHIPGLIFSPVFNLRVGESQHEVDTILKIIDMYHIQRFVEIGVHAGGLTEFLLNKTSCEYLGVEINAGIPDERIKSLVNNHGDEILYMDCMTDIAYEKIKYFAGRGKVLVYCDNGNKSLEIKKYYDVIRPGSILLTHDFTDGSRQVRDLPYHYYDTREVTVEDIAFMEADKTFKRLPEDLLKETRNIGWLKL